MWVVGPDPLVHILFFLPGDRQPLSHWKAEETEVCVEEGLVQGHCKTYTHTHKET